MSDVFEYHFTVGDRDADGMGLCRASALLGYLQDAAAGASRYGGFGREALMEKYGAFWMLARNWFRLDRPLRWKDQVTVRTWHRGSHGAMMYRDYDILVDGVPIGESVSGWVLAKKETRRLLCLSEVGEMSANRGEELCKTVTLAKLRRPEDLHLLERRPVHYSDTDLNGHMNNARYADFACDALRLDRLEQEEGKYLASLRLGYVAECRPGEVLSILEGPGMGGETYLCGLDETGKTRFEAAALFGQNPSLTTL